MNVLSLFDGMSCGRIALERADIKVDNYYSSEIDKYAIQIANKNYPQDADKRLGNILDWEFWDIDWSSIDLVTGGFPCQAWSVAGKQLGDKDERGMLFWTMLDIMKKVLEHNPKAKFLIENVKMKKEFEEYITFHTTQALGKLDKHLINSSLVSAQNRERYYWTNISFDIEIEDKNIFIKDILDNQNDFFEITENMIKNYSDYSLMKFKKNIISDNSKAKTLTTNSLRGTIDGGNIHIKNNRYYNLTPIECERLQTVPDNYTDGVSNSQRYKMIGNGWTVDVIAHILKGIKES